MGVFNFFNKDNDRVSEQRILADKICREDPNRAMRIALGEEFADEILSALVYAEICNQAEKELNAETENTPEHSEKLEICMKLGNSYKNRKISAIAQKIKVRDKYQVIELIKDVVNARIKALEKERGKTYEKIMEDEVNLITE